MRCRIIMRTMTYFYPRPPGGGRRSICMLTDAGDTAISIHALRVEGDAATITAHVLSTGISIHALRVEGDAATITAHVLSTGISIHALRVEGDCFPEFFGNSLLGFLSTPSGWRATSGAERRGRRRDHISIHALRVEGDAKFLMFSPHFT